MIVTQQTAVHLGNANLGNLNSTKNQPQRTVKHLFDVTIKLVKDQKEFQGFSMINWQEHSWKRTTLLTDREVRLSTAKAYVFSDSVLCMGRISENPVEAWEKKSIGLWSTGSRWSSGVNISQDSQHCRFSPRARTWWLKLSVNLSNSQDGSFSCQCKTTLYGEKKETKNCVLRIAKS